MQLPAVDVAALPDPIPVDLVVLDVREDDEWAAGHIDGATLIPLGQLPARLAEVPDGRLLVVCRVGARSARATAYLLGQGRDAVNLDGGMREWSAAGRAMVADGAAAPEVI
ncbi:MAG: rhodanese-like domain-containing protein [Nocardioidaceae bacterium]